MNVTIIGAGNMGRGIATRAIAGGNEVKIVATFHRWQRPQAAVKIGPHKPQHT